MSKFAESAALPARIFRAVMAVLLCVGLMIPAIPVSQASAATGPGIAQDGYSHGTVKISADDTAGTIELEVGQTATVKVSPYQHMQTRGCGMSECPEICGGTGCFTPNEGCVCDPSPELRTVDIEAAPVDEGIVTVSEPTASENIDAAEIGATNDAALTITAKAAGETELTVKANEKNDLQFWYPAEETYTIKVTDPSAASDPDTPELVEGAYQIGSAADLQWFADYANEDHLDAKAKITANITLEDGVLPSVGSSSSNRFTGAIDGDGHTISGITSFANASHPGLVGYLGDGGTIKNLTLAGAVPYVNGAGGAFASMTYAGSLIENCVNEVDLSSSNRSMGGFAYSVAGTISSCTNKADITCKGSNAYVGGIVGTFSSGGKVVGCSNEGNITGLGCTGGIAGQASSRDASVESCRNVGTVTNTGPGSGSLNGRAGGIVGYSQPMGVAIASCYNEGAVTSTDTTASIGGILGQCNEDGASITSCFNIGTVSGADNAGAIMGSASRENTVPSTSNLYYLDSSCDAAVGGEFQPAELPVSKTADEMKSAEMAAALGPAFKQGAEHPILTWQPDEAVTPSVAGAKVVEGQQVQLRQSGETGSARVNISDLPEGWAEAVTSVSVKAVNGNDAGTVTELKSDQYTIDTENNRVVFNRTEEAPVFSVAVGEGEELTVSGWRGDTVYPQSKVYEITIKANGFADTVGTVTFYTGASETFYVAVDENKNGKVDDGEVKKTFSQKEIEEMSTFQNGSSQCGMTGFRTFSAVGVPVSTLLEKAGVEVDANDKFKLDTTDNFGSEFTYDQLFGERYFLQCAYDDEDVKEVYDRVSQAEGDAATGANVELRRILAEKALEDGTRSYPMISANYAETMLDGDNVGTTAVPTEDNTEVNQLVGAENQYRFTYGIALVQEDCDVTFETGEGSDVATQTVKSHLMTSTENTTIKSTYWNNGIIITPDAAEAEQPSTAADKLTQPEDPTRDGYTFAGWWTKDGSESGDWGEQFDFTANDGTVDSDTTLYAKWVANDQVMENTDATVSAYREAKYGTPPNGEATTDGQHLQISILFDGAVEVTDEEALLNSLNCKLSGDYALDSAKADGTKLILEATGTMLPGGQTKVSAKAESGVIEGVTVDGKAAKLKPIDTIADTSLTFEVVEAVAGTETTPASTTFKVTHSANVRSMNNVLWLTNGGTDETGHDIFGGADWKPAHHHMYWQFDLNTSADFIRQGSETALGEAGYTLTVSGENGEFTVTAKTPKAGEVLSAVVYNDSFLHEYGLANGQAVTGIEMPDAKTTVDLGMSFPTEPEYVSTDMGRDPAGKVDFSLTPSEGALDAYKQARSEATVQTMLQDWIDSISSVTVDGKKLTGKAFDEWKSELTNAKDDAGKLNYYELTAGAKAATLTLPIALFDTTANETATAKVVIESDGFATVSGDVIYRNIGAEDLVVRILDENGKVARTSVLKASDLRKLDVQEHYNTSANCGMAGLRSYNSEGVLLTDVLEAAGVNFEPGMTLKLRTNDSLDSNGTADTTEDGYIFSGTFTYEELLGTDRYYYPAAWDDTTTYDELDGQTIYDVLSQDMDAWKTDGKYADVLPQLLGQGKQKVEPILAWSWNEGVISWGGSNPAEAEGYNGYSDQESFRFLFGMKAAQDGSITDDNTTFSNTYGVFGIDVIAADASQADNPNEFKIEYELDGGVNNPDNPTSYEQGTEVELLDPTREGYTFGGWFVDESFATQITEIPPYSSGDITLYAKWIDESGEQPGDDPNGQGGNNNNNNQNVNVNVDNGGNGNTTDAGKGTAQTGDTMLAVPFACLAGLALVIAAIAAIVRRRNGMGDRN